MCHMRRQELFCALAERRHLVTALHFNPRAEIAEVPVSVDWSSREGESKLRVLPTMRGYARVMARQATAKGRAV